MVFWIILAVFVILAGLAVCSMVINYKASVLFDYWMHNLKLDHKMHEDWLWGLIQGAHKRRKRVEKMLQRERRRSTWRRQEILGLQHQLVLQEMRNQSLAADLAAAILNSEDKATVRERLVRKIR